MIFEEFPMRRMTLAEYVDEVGQTQAAINLGCTQSAISKALFAERTVYVHVSAAGGVEAEELKPFPSHKQNVGT